MLENAPQHNSQLPIYIGQSQSSLSGLFFGNDDNIHPVRDETNMMPEKFSQQPFDSVAHDGLADLAGNSCSQTRRGGVFTPPITDENNEMFCMETLPGVIACRKVGTPEHAMFPRPASMLCAFVRSGTQGLPPFHD